MSTQRNGAQMTHNPEANCLRRAWPSASDVPEGELVAEAGQEGLFAGGQAGRWQAVGRPVQQGRALGGQGGELWVGVGLDPPPVARLGRQAGRGH
jgi:hypothetical protein